MFQFWFNTYFITDEEIKTLESEAEVYGDDVSPTCTKMNVTRTQSDQTRIVDRIAAKQRRLRKQLNNELLTRARRIDSNDHLNLPKSDLARHQLPAAQFYDVPTNGASQLTQPSPRTYKVLRLRKCEIDRANKDKQHRLYPADFAVSCCKTLPSSCR